MNDDLDVYRAALKTAREQLAEVLTRRDELLREAESAAAEMRKYHRVLCVLGPYVGEAVPELNLEHGALRCRRPRTRRKALKSPDQAGNK